MVPAPALQPGITTELLGYRVINFEDNMRWPHVDSFKLKLHVSSQTVRPDHLYMVTQSLLAIATASHRPIM